MAEVSNANNSNNVSAGKGVKGGYIFSAPVGTTLPDKVIKNKSELDPAFKCLGFISEDGYVESVSEDSKLCKIISRASFRALIKWARMSTSKLSRQVTEILYIHSSLARFSLS